MRGLCFLFLLAFCTSSYGLPLSQMARTQKSASGQSYQRCIEACNRQMSQDVFHDSWDHRGMLRSRESLENQKQYHGISQNRCHEECARRSFRE